jgi:hypothetical protein
VTLTLNPMTPLPPKHDPDRPLYLAVRSTWLLGAVSMLCGLIVVLAFGYFNPYRLYRHYFIVGGMGVWFVPGVLLVVSSVFLARRSLVAAGVATVTAFGQGVCAAVLFYASVTLEPVSAIPVVLSALWVAAIVQLIHHLWRSFASIRMDVARRPGFDMGTPRAVLPVEADPAGDVA